MTAALSNRGRGGWCRDADPGCSLGGGQGHGYDGYPRDRKGDSVGASVCSPRALGTSAGLIDEGSQSDALRGLGRRVSRVSYLLYVGIGE